MGDITKNFSYWEFKPHKAEKTWRPNSEYQKLLITNLAKNLQIVKDNAPSNCVMNITSGVRDISDFFRLKNSGYNPSTTSDHYCGAPIKIKKINPKYIKFGEVYCFSSGAADITPAGISAWDLFKLAFNLINAGACDFGQIIYEKDPKNGSEWTHFSGSYNNLFSDDIVAIIGRQKILKSVDGGKNYSIVTSI